MSHGEEPGQGHTGKKRKAGFLVSALLVLVLLGVGVLAGGFFSLFGAAFLSGRSVVR